MFSKPLMLLLLTSLSSLTFAKEWQVQMLNYGAANEGGMIFQPAYIHADIGDTVTFIPTHSGHNAQSYVVPKEAKKWKTPLDKEYTLRLDQEGIHLYYCTPHLMMGMVGIIQVGEAKNLSVVQQKAPRLRSKMALKPARIDDLLAMIQAP